MKKYSILLAGLVIATGLTSCLKSNRDLITAKESPVVVGFKDVTPPTSGATAPFRAYVPKTLDPNLTEVSFDSKIHYSGVGGAPSDITVQLAMDPTAITTYNTSEKTALVMPGASSFTVPASVTIKKGENDAVIPITVKVGTLNQAVSNAIALKISSVSGNQKISGNFGTIIFSLPIKSLWEGVYTYGIVNDFGAIDGNIGGSFEETDVRLSTVGPNLVEVQYLWRTYSGWTRYQFSGDNSTITKIIAFSGSERATVINSVDFVNPATKSFKVTWTCLNRGIRETFTRTGD